MENAIEVCIREGVLEEFLRKHRAEVTDMFLTDYDEELHIRSEKALSYEEGYQGGKDEGEALKLIKQIAIKLKKDKSYEVIADELEEKPEKIRKICEFVVNHDFGNDFGRLYKLLRENELI